MNNITKTLNSNRFISLMQTICKVACTTLLVFFTPLLLHSQDCDNNIVLDIFGPIAEDWTAPATGGPFSVRITAVGAGGGRMTDLFFNDGGSGASMSGTFVVQNGQTIRAIAGDFGKDATLEGAGAGGGSGAVNCGTSGDCVTGVILVIAAGGNGGDIVDGLGGSASTNGSGSGGAAGGDPLHEPDWGAGGGGLNSDGQSASGTGGDGGGQVDKNGLSPGGLGSGTQVPNNGGDGMGGGGGGGDYGAGGGGGHTGGNGGNGSAASSFNSGTAQVNTPGLTSGGNNIGSVTIVCLASLPVELTDFKALIQKNGGVTLHWNTASEKNNHGFDLERSVDGRHWAALGFVPGNGTTTRPNKYFFTDEKPLAGINYYRLKQMDADGKFEYSPIVVADVQAHVAQFDIFPNPSPNGVLSARVVSKMEGEVLLEIFDWAGYKVWKETLNLVEGTIVWPVSMATFPKGAYTARLELPGGEVHFKKILLQ